MGKVKEIPIAVYKNPKVRLAFKGLLLAASAVIAGQLGFDEAIVSGLIG